VLHPLSLKRKHIAQAGQVKAKKEQAAAKSAAKAVVKAQANQEQSTALAGPFRLNGPTKEGSASRTAGKL
jgi:hypothetical protein